MSFSLKPATQPCPFSCFSTVIGIITGINAQSAHRAFHNEYWHGVSSIRSVLNGVGLPYTAYSTVDRNSIESPGIHLCSVPSLNVVGGSHYVVVEVLTLQDWQVLDPAKGRIVDGKPRKYYIADNPTAEEPLAVLLEGGYNLEASFKPEDVLKWRERNGIK